MFSSCYWLNLYRLTQILGCWSKIESNTTSDCKYKIRELHLTNSVTRRIWHLYTSFIFHCRAHYTSYDNTRRNNNRLAIYIVSIFLYFYFVVVSDVCEIDLIGMSHDLSCNFILFVANIFFLQSAKNRILQSIIIYQAIKYNNSLQLYLINPYNMIFTEASLSITSLFISSFWSFASQVGKRVATIENKNFSRHKMYICISI
jgi:hypothetical protein